MHRRLGQRLSAIALRELAETAWLFALLIGCLWLLTGWLDARADAAGLLGFLGDLTVDANHNPIAPRFFAALRLSATLIGGALLVALPLATLVGWAAAVSPTAERLRLLVTATSAVPMVAAGALIQRAYGNHVALPIAVLATTELTLGAMAAQIREGLARELSADYLDTARAKGAPPIRHYWMPMLGIVFGAIRPRLPYLIGATIVVERIFTFDHDGLANLVFGAMERQGDAAILCWVSAFGLLLVRLTSLAEQLLNGVLDPRAGATDEADALGLGRWRPDVSGGLASLPLLARRLRETAADAAASLRRTPAAARRTLSSAASDGAPGVLRLLVLVGLTTATLALLAVCLSGWRPHPLETGVHAPYAAPDPAAARYLGADALGRDLLSEILAAGANMARPLTLGVLLPVLLGTLLGVWAGCGAGLLRRLVASLVDLVEALPKLILVLAAIWVVEVDADWLDRLFPLIGLTFTPMVFYAVRARTRRVVNEGFLEAQRALGASPWRILLRHVLWNNCRGAVLVQASLLVGYVLMMDLTLGYLGYCQPDEDLITWGRMVYVGLRETAHPLLALAPLGAVALTTITCAVWGDALESAS